MPYSKAHKENTRTRILESAVELFSRHGFDKVSIDDLMQHAKLTRGAFYAHFESKSDVYFHAITDAAVNAFAIRSAGEELEGASWLKHFVHTYLSEDHVNQINSPCPLAFMVTDVANSDPKVKEAYTKVFSGLNKVLHQHLAKQARDEDNRKQKVLAVSAMLIGSVAIGRVLQNTTLRTDLLTSSSEIASWLLNLDL